MIKEATNTRYSKFTYNSVEFKITEHLTETAAKFRFEAKIGNFQDFGETPLNAARNCALKLMNWALKN